MGGKRENPFDLFWVMAKWREGWWLARTDESGSESEDFACVLASTAHATNEKKFVLTDLSKSFRTRILK